MNLVRRISRASRTIAFVALRKTSRLSRFLLLLVLPTCLLSFEADCLAQGFPQQISPSPNERFGFGVPSESDILDYDVAKLRAGWYVDWGVRSQAPRPAGLEHIQVIRVCDDTLRDCQGHPYRPYGLALASAVSNNIGNLWLIGNEPDTCYGQDCVRPDRYAEVYHELHDLLKSLDPSCQVAIGGVVQATPLRLEYLDIILGTYLSRYGERMPVDVWNVHNFVLRERQGDWGCGVPPGLSASEGEIREIDDHDSISIFEEQVRVFREWMRDNGERHKPLIISEYGILFPEELGYDLPRVRDFMLGSFDLLASLTDHETGYPADDDHLVQRWAWYSLDDDKFECSSWDPPCTTWSNLFDPTTRGIEALGEDFGDYIADNELIKPYRDLEPITLTIGSDYPLVYDQPTTLTLSSRVVNWGNSATGSFQVAFRVDAGPLDEIAFSAGLGPRYEGQMLTEISWTDPVTSPHAYSVVVDSAEDVNEWREDNNSVSLDVDVDLAAGQFRSSVARTRPGQTADITVTASISNPGDVSVRSIVVELQDVVGKPVGSTILSELAPGTQVDVPITWPQQPVGAHVAVMTVDAPGVICESDELNNQAVGITLVAAHVLFLPYVAGNGGS